MALNLSILRTRAITAIVFVMVMMGGLLYNQWSFLLLFSIILVGCFYEYHQLMGKINEQYQATPFIFKLQSILSGLWLMLILAGKSRLYQAIPLWDLAIWIIILAGILFAITAIFFRNSLGYPVNFYTTLGILYITMPSVMMIDLYDKSIQYFTGANWVLPMTIIATIWINDTMAYLVGSLIGKTPLSSISPKKTKEGTYGGMVLAVLVVSLGGYFIGGMAIKPLLFISITASIAGTLGDLLESKIKRKAGVKDSGTFMPGHGGFLDRFDSLLIAIPAVWLVLFLFL
ncbi:MAG: phosphatidate cytidylyltransferase [Sphingobacteriia bacterium]|nr:MAG: phosphatidate cytidylyltransferase [Sphingobacteriia bacterium]TAG30370.1 MAG: phosphatidate cytidylyltransferase [Sphingobacteriia bacterium]